VPRPSQRSRLLDAAAALIAENGFRALTLEAVAQRAGTTKGGLLYHFRSKEALIAALVSDLLGRFVARLAAARGDGRPALLAYVEASLGKPKVVGPRLGTALLSAMTTDPRLAAPLRQHYAELRAALPRAEFERAAQVLLATDGLWILELVGLSPFTAAERRRIVRSLAALARLPSPLSDSRPAQARQPRPAAPYPPAA